MAIKLNGFRLEFSSSSFEGTVADFPNSELVASVRTQHTDQWFVYWRGGKLFGLPLFASTKSPPGSIHTFAVDDHDTLHVLSARLGEVLPSLFPNYRPARRRWRAFSFLAQKENTEIVALVTSGWKNVHPLVSTFTIRPRFNLEPRIIEDRAGQTSIALFLDVQTRWEIRAPLGELVAAGIDLSGLAVIRRDPAPGQKSLVGTIRCLSNDRVELEESFENTPDVAVDTVWLEGSRASFSRSLRHILGGRFDHFEDGREAEECRLFLGPELDALLGDMESFLQKKGWIKLGRGVSCRVLGRIELTNTAGYQSVRKAPDVEYCFDAAKTKRDIYPWRGLNKHGPFDRGIFPKLSPRVLVVTPDQLSGRTSTFTNLFKNGITSLGHSQYQKGFAATFGLANPTFTPVSVRLLGVDEGRIAAAYRKAIEDQLGGADENYDTAFVVLQDAHGRLPDPINPYLHAKATLLMHGIPSQECRLTTISGDESDLQWKLPNLAVAMYAKLGGTPWTVAQGQTADDEIVVGMGMAELSNSRFEERQRFVGITTVFRGDGNYLLSNVSRVCDYAEYPEMLRATTTGVLEDLRERNGWKVGNTIRVVFHARKPLRNVEVAQIVQDCVEKVGQGLNIEFAFLTVETSHPFKLFDPDQPGIVKRAGQPLRGVYAPDRGVIAQLGRYTRLLVTNGPHQVKRPATPLPSPLLIHLHRNSLYVDLDYLTEQVLKFTSLTWRSTLPAYAPVTIYYSELIAEMLARLQTVAEWSPAVLNTKLKFSRWFL